MLCYVMPTQLHIPGCNLRQWYGLPLDVHCWADLQSVRGFRCYGNIHSKREMLAGKLAFAVWLVQIYV